MATVTIDQWVAQSEARMLAVFRESAQRLVSLMQSRVPVDTGFCRASIRASLIEMPRVESSASRPKTGKNSVPYDPTNVTVVIAQAQLGQPIFVGWTANYAEELERGHSRQAPSGFVRVSVLEWPRIVSETTAEAKRRATQ